MKIKIELYGASKDFSSKNIIELDLKNNSRIKDLRNELIKFHTKDYIDAIENMSRDEIETRLKELREQHPQMFVDADYEVVNDKETRKSIVDKSQREDASPLVQDEN